jgi:hypothetical protein
MNNVRGILKAKSKAIILKIVLIIGINIVLLHLCSRIITGNPWFYSDTLAVNGLSKMLPILKEYHITEYRNQDWCKVLDYKYGFYWNSTHPTTCALAGDYQVAPLSPFNELADYDFSKLKTKLFFTGIKIYMINVDYDEYGEISNAEFELDDYIFTRARYIYSPTKTPTDKAGEATNYLIKPSWYFTLEDWM